MSSPVPIAYTKRDYEGIREDLISHIQQTFPEWTYTGPGDFGVLLLELWAHVGDVLNFYVDRGMFEGFVQTAVLRSSMLNLAQMFGYTPNRRSAATTQVQITVANTGQAVTVPALTPLLTGPTPTGGAPVVFETQSSVTIPAGAASTTVSAVEGRSIKQEPLGEIDGTIFQEFSLFYPNVIGSSALVEVSERDDLSGQPEWSVWDEVPRFGDVGATDNIYTTYLDENNVTHVVFGDNVYGRVPAIGADVRVSYRTGVGAIGNVPAGSILALGVAIVGVLQVTNITDANGGADDESIDSMRSSIPTSLRGLERCVSLQDFESLSLRIPGVQKTVAQANSHTNVIVYVAPVGGGNASAPLKSLVQTYLQNKSMIGTTVTVGDPIYVQVNVTATVHLLPTWIQSRVTTNVTLAIQNLLTLSTSSFGRRVTLGEMYRTVYEIDGVDYATIDVLSRSGGGVSDIISLPYELPIAGTISAVPVGGVVG